MELAKSMRNIALCRGWWVGKGGGGGGGVNWSVRNLAELGYTWTVGSRVAMFGRILE